MTKPIGEFPNAAPLQPQGTSVSEVSQQLRATLLNFAQNLQDLLNQPGKLGNDDFLMEVQKNGSQLSALVAMAHQC